MPKPCGKNLQTWNRPQKGRERMKDICLAPVSPEELPNFSRHLQEAFGVALREKFGVQEEIPSAQEIRRCYQARGEQTHHLLWRGRRVGGAMLRIDPAGGRNALDLFFISPAYHSQGLGLAAWRAIEAAYPDTVVWETITPYFEERNIHFYVNKCGFHIVEFFNPHHLDPNLPPPTDSNGDPIPGEETYFRFEKVMRPEAMR